MERFDTQLTDELPFSIGHVFVYFQIFFFIYICMLIKRNVCACVREYHVRIQYCAILNTAQCCDLRIQVFLVDKAPCVISWRECIVDFYCEPDSLIGNQSLESMSQVH